MVIKMAMKEQKNWFYFFAKAILKPVLKIYNRVTVHGTDQIPTSGSLIIVANHVSILDPVYIGLNFKKISCISC